MASKESGLCLVLEMIIESMLATADGVVGGCMTTMGIDVVGVSDLEDSVHRRVGGANEFDIVDFEVGDLRKVPEKLGI